MDPIRRASMFIRMNDLLIQNVVVIPVLWRSVVSGLSNSLRGPGISGWDSSLFWNLAHWYREV
jgi:peptide/nickel transport system substrate-binding protein